MSDSPTPPIDEQGKPSWSRLWLGRWLWWMIAASSYVLLRTPDDALLAIVEVLLGSVALAIALALIGAVGGPRIFQYIAPAVSAAAGKVKSRVASLAGSRAPADPGVDRTDPPAMGGGA